jgi:hypothetical protein
MAHLSKSDFKVAHSCATKLWYKKHGYPTSNDENEYMKMLADGGFMFGKLAMLLFPEGIEVTGTIPEAITSTERMLSDNRNIVLFEPAISVNNQLVRVDVLVKVGDLIKVIEVKSKSFDSVKMAQESNYWFNPKYDFKPYIEDIAYQTKVVREKFPHAKVESYLMMPDTSTVSQFDDLINQFQIVDIPPTPNSRYRNVDVLFTGSDELLQNVRSAYENDQLFVNLIPMDDQVSQVINDVTHAANIFVDAVVNDTKIETPLTCNCKSCEFTLTDENHPVSGFDTCWGELAKVEPHILTLGQLGNVNKKTLNNERRGAGEIGCIDELIQEGKVSLNDLPLELVTSTNGKPFYNDRPLFQLTQKEELILPGLKSEMQTVEYPIHFIDFETNNMCIPLHENMRPYENVIFQWSCHTITHPGATPIHTEWLNTVDRFPNIAFAQSLKDQLGLEGTFLTWSPYENTQLKAVHNYLEELNNPAHLELKNWLNRVVSFHDEDVTKLLDMHDLAKKYYFHPIMGGRTSIKVALPAVLNASTSTVIKDWLKAEGLYAKDENGIVINPYKLLPEPEINVGGQKIVVKEGGGAMSAYKDMLYGINKDNQQVKALYEAALKKYCKLDTLSMACIWQHWSEKI